jgi:hypothetical protein
MIPRAARHRVALADSRRWALRSRALNIVEELERVPSDATILTYSSYSDVRGFADEAAPGARALHTDDSVTALAWRGAERAAAAACTLQTWWPRARVLAAARAERARDVARARSAFAALASAASAARTEREKERARAAARECVAARLGLVWHARVTAARLRDESTSAFNARLARTRARAVRRRFFLRVEARCLERRDAFTTRVAALASIAQRRLAMIRIAVSRAVAKAAGAAAAALAAAKASAAANSAAERAVAALLDFRGCADLFASNLAAREEAVKGRRMAQHAARTGAISRLQRGLDALRIARALSAAAVRRRNAQKASIAALASRARAHVASSLQRIFRGGASRSKTRAAVRAATLKRAAEFAAATAAATLLTRTWRARLVARREKWGRFVDGQSGHLVWAREDGEGSPRWRLPCTVGSAVALLCACRAAAIVECAECWRTLCASCNGVAHAAGYAARHARRALRDADAQRDSDAQWPPQWPSDEAADRAADEIRRGRAASSLLKL